VQKGENFNHPIPGSMIKVEPIRTLKDIKAIKRLLNNPRDFALFVVGINTNLRASDLLQILAGQVRHSKPMDDLVLKEKKTGDEPIFSGKNGALTVPSINRVVKQWCKTINLKGNFGSHTLRKTWGYHQRVTYGRGTPELMVCFNHSTEKQTLEYLCVQPEEIKNIYANEL